MPYTPSPLRYPGGKAKLYNYIRSLIEINGLLGETYIEPFAGGAGLALKLLQNNDVRRIVINDYDPAIYAFWYSILHNAQQMCDFVNTVPLTVDEWDKQHDVYSNQEDHSQLELAKAVLYLNRTNVSGIINGGIIGKRDQTGNYKMDARFNRTELIRKINSISELSDRIVLYPFCKPSYVIIIKRSLILTHHMLQKAGSYIKTLFQTMIMRSLGIRSQLAEENGSLLMMSVILYQHSMPVVEAAI